MNWWWKRSVELRKEERSVKIEDGDRWRFVLIIMCVMRKWKWGRLIEVFVVSVVFCFVSICSNLFGFREVLVMGRYGVKDKFIVDLLLYID